MSFLKRIWEIAKGPKTAKEQEPESEQVASDGAGDGPELAPLSERLDRLKTLTPREQEVYEHLIHGRKMREIAKLLGVTHATVNFHCQGLYKKLGINTRAQLFIQYATLDGGEAKKH
ncbi:MAG: helix-turn-helix transcriptional regulator [Clostridia bacterium]|jgi:DNA-binding NarL/FixJ family response regulator|nr:helix-turn-helix transcriptional regulator [Clostridia bacterium]